MSIIHVGITGIGYEVGEKVATNEDVSAIVKTAVRTNKRLRQGTRKLTPDEAKNQLCSAEWLAERNFHLRVHTRRTTVDLGVAAARKAIEMSGCRKKDISAVLFGTVSPNYNQAPTCAQLAIRDLGLEVKNDQGLKYLLPGDIGNTCSTPSTTISLAWSVIKSGLVKRVLVILADKMTSTVDESQRDFFPLMGDAGTAIILEATTESNDSFPWQDKSFFSAVEPSGVENIITRAGGSAQPITFQMLRGSASKPFAQRPDRLWQNGRRVHGHMVKYLSDPVAAKENTNHIVFGAGLCRAGLTFDDIKVIYPHQASVRMNIEVLTNLRKLGYNGRMSDTGKLYGNTTSAAVLLGVATEFEQGLLNYDDIAAMAPFGAGYTGSLIFFRNTLNILCPV